MADDPFTVSGGLPGPPSSEPPDIMNDAEFNPPQPTRRDTTGSKASEGGSEKIDYCRICRSEATPEEPLFYPCKCSGSIKFVHQECLMEWLSHSHKKHCELCKTPFRFTKLYDANMPQTLPWDVFLKTAFKHVGLTLWKTLRTLLVVFVWLGIVPWLIRWVWRCLFWMADAAWAREDFKDMIVKHHLQRLDQTSVSEPTVKAILSFFRSESSFNTSEASTIARLSRFVFAYLGSESGNNTIPTNLATLPQADTSILSSWSYLASLTNSTNLNRAILDVFEGQLITCVIITGFILVFLIREWVVQQQPLVNQDIGEQQLRERGRQLRAQLDEAERVRRQAELLNRARARLDELGDATESGSSSSIEKIEFMGWESLEDIIDHATEHLRKGGGWHRQHFETNAQRVTQQILAAGRTDVNMDDLMENVYKKLAGYTKDERWEWEAVLVSELKEKASNKIVRSDHSDLQSEEQHEDGSAGESSTVSSRRPPMPNRDFSSRATHIQRLLTEAEDGLREVEDAQPSNARSRDESTQQPHASNVAITFTPSGQEVTLPSGSSIFERGLRSSKVLESVPIINAGPDAKINIKRSEKGRMKAVPAPDIKAKMLNKDEELRKLDTEVEEEVAEEKRLDAATSTPVTQPRSTNHSTAEDNPFHPDGAMPERRNSESFGNRVASVFREEFGLDEAEELENMRQMGVGPDGEPTPNDRPADTPLRYDDRPPTHFQRLTDWFWGDIQAPDAPEPIPVANEERQQPEGDNGAQVAAFVPAQTDQPANPPPVPADAQPEQPPNDPEVVAAAQQAALDPEAVDDAEDLEGIFELVGLQGPLIALFQTSAFCMLLVACTILGAVIVPYLGGKLVLSLAGNPGYFVIQMPLQAANFVANFLIDFTLLVLGWLVVTQALVVDLVLAAAQMRVPSLGSVKCTAKIVEFAVALATSSTQRLRVLFSVSEPTEGLAWNWAVLCWSVHAHASLRTIQGEINTVLNYAGTAVTWTVDTISSGSVLEVCTQSLKALTQISEAPAKIRAGAVLAQHHTKPLTDFLISLSRGALILSTPEIPMDPTLVYWDSTDRTLAILAGYTALAALAAIYVAMDTPITRSEAGRKTEKMVRDSLRQAGGVLKVILIISIEMLVFPLYCGLLLDVAFLPLFKDANVASRWAFAGEKPYKFCFVHWFIGTCYMFHFALFVGMCRKILRKGVLWFIRDPDDPNFHPVRDVLERNVATQLRKIAFSALVYGALVILCLGGVIWAIGHVLHDVFPIYWTSTDPLLEFPMDLFLFNSMVPLVWRLFKPTDAVNAIYAWWLQQCARRLRLSHFLFDDRRKDEEGHMVYKSWSSFLRLWSSGSSNATLCDDCKSEQTDQEAEIQFKHDGEYMLTPCNDQYRPPKEPGEAFWDVDEDDMYILDKDGNKNDHFAKVYVPPLFRLRLAIFMLCLWIFSAIMGLCATLLPLLLGRYLFAKTLPHGMRVNDIYTYFIGASTLGTALLVTLKGQSVFSYLKEKMSSVDVKAFIEPTLRIGGKALRCAYVYGFLGIVLPAVFALILQFYFVLPLHTWAMSTMESHDTPWQSVNNTMSTFNGSDAESLLSKQVIHSEQYQMPSLAEHSFHLLQDYVLGLIYVRIASRLIIAAPASRAAEAFRRITVDGYLNPNVKLASRFFVLPVTLMCAFVLLFPPLAANATITVLNSFSKLAVEAETQTKLYRYSYPIVASFVVFTLAASGLGRATRRWRARIRDEVYLVGERLHNFGEKKPPVGSKPVVRKEK